MGTHTIGVGTVVPMVWGQVIVALRQLSGRQDREFRRAKNLSSPIQDSVPICFAPAKQRKGSTHSA